MARWVQKGGRTDVILHPREWRIWIWRWGVGYSFTGQYDLQGRVLRNNHRIGTLQRNRRGLYLMGAHPLGRNAQPSAVSKASIGNLSVASIEIGKTEGRA